MRATPPPTAGIPATWPRLLQPVGWTKSGRTSSTPVRMPSESRLAGAGLTVIAFSNNHLVHALTCGVLALMAAAGASLVNLDRLRPHWMGLHPAGLPDP